MTETTNILIAGVGGGGTGMELIKSFKKIGRASCRERV